MGNIVKYKRDKGQNGWKNRSEGTLMMTMKTKSSLDSLGALNKKQLHIFGPNTRLVASEQNKTK